MIHSLNYLQTFRKRIGISLKDMAFMIGMDAGNLSKIESGRKESGLNIILAYKLILAIPIEKLFKKQYPETIKKCLRNAVTLKDTLLEIKQGSDKEPPNLNQRINGIDTIIDRLVDKDCQYEG